jgi:hypothetical protein
LQTQLNEFRAFSSLTPIRRPSKKSSSIGYVCAKWGTNGTIQYCYCKSLASSESSFAMIIGKGLFMSLVLGLLSSLSVSGAIVLPVASFSTVLTEIAQQVGGDHVVVVGLVRPG